MADRTTAALFAEVFDFLARDPTEENKAFARRLFGRWSDYDFSPYQMYCDDSLKVLGLARLGVDPRWPEEGEVWLYGPEKYSR